MRCTDLETQEKSQVKVVAESGVMTSQRMAGPPEALRGKEGFFPRDFRQNVALPRLDFKLLASETVIRYIAAI